MGCDKNWLVKMLQAELEAASIGPGEANAIGFRLADKLMRECDISPSSARIRGEPHPRRTCHWGDVVRGEAEPR